MASIIELDEIEKKLFKATIKIDALEDLILEANLNLSESDIASATKAVDIDYIYDGKLDTRVSEVYEHYLGELKRSHAGDCTCFPISCSKCQAEHFLGIDTIPQMSKHVGYVIYEVFNGREITCDAAIKELIDNGANNLAISWLENYRDTKLKRNKMSV